jgi:hypothetical protein
MSKVKHLGSYKILIARGESQKVKFLSFDKWVQVKDAIRHNRQTGFESRETSCKSNSSKQKSSKSYLMTLA